MSCPRATVEKWSIEIICRHQDATPNAILPEKKNKTCARCISPCTCVCTRSSSTGRRKKRQCFLIQTPPKSNCVFHHYLPHERVVREFSRRMKVVEAIKAKFEEKYKVYMQMKEANAIDRKKFVAE